MLTILAWLAATLQYMFLYKTVLP